MPIMVMYHVSGTPEEMGAAWEANPDLHPIFENATKKSGSKRLGSLIGDGKVIELEEYPSREAFESFKAETKDASAKMDAHVGSAPEVEVYEFHPAEDH